LANQWAAVRLEPHRAIWRKMFGCVRDTLAAGDANSEWFPTLCPKSVDILKSHQACYPEPDGTCDIQVAAAKRAERFVVDYGQGLSNARVPHSRFQDGVTLAPPFIAGTKLWLGGPQHRQLTGYEMMLFQGWPLGRKDTFEAFVQSGILTDAQMRNMALHSFPGTVLVAIVTAILFAGDWHEVVKPAPTCQSDVQQAMALFTQAMD